MLTENDIVVKLTAYLKEQGYEIVQSLSTDEQGVDIIAKGKSRKLFIEVKGETSSKSHTNRFGKQFTRAQIKSHISKAIFASMKILSSKSEGKNIVVAIALPDTKVHRELMNEIKLSIKKLKIIIFWVSINDILQE